MCRYMYAYVCTHTSTNTHHSYTTPHIHTIYVHTIYTHHIHTSYFIFSFLIYKHSDMPNGVCLSADCAGYTPVSAYQKHSSQLTHSLLCLQHIISRRDPAGTSFTVYKNRLEQRLALRHIGPIYLLDAVEGSSPLVV